MVDSDAGRPGVDEPAVAECGPGQPPADGEGPPPSRYAERIQRLAAEAGEARAALTGDLPAPDEQRALEAARDGLGPVVACYIEARTGDDLVRLSAREHRLLRQATRDWLECFARWHGVAHDADATVRAGAELLLDTHDIVAVAELLTGVGGQ